MEQVGKRGKTRFVSTLLHLLHHEEFVTNSFLCHRSDGVTVEMKDEEFLFMLCVSHMHRVCCTSLDPKLNEKMLNERIIDELVVP